MTTPPPCDPFRPFAGVPVTENPRIPADMVIVWERDAGDRLPRHKVAVGISVQNAQAFADALSAAHRGDVKGMKSMTLYRVPEWQRRGGNPMFMGEPAAATQHPRHQWYGPGWPDWPGAETERATG